MKPNPGFNSDVYYFPSKFRVFSSFYGSNYWSVLRKIFDSKEYADRDQFLALICELVDLTIDKSDEYDTIYSPYGGTYVMPLVAANAPNSMIYKKQVEDYKTINIYFDLSFAYNENITAVYNRALATLYLIQLLEKNRYFVNFNVFSLAKNYDEYVNIEVNLKPENDRELDSAKCYYPLSNKAFLRRIIFAILETIPVQSKRWGENYGEVLSDSEIREFYHLNDKDIVIAAPKNMGLRGQNFNEDLVTFLDAVNLENYVENVQDIYDKVKEFKKEK